MLNRKNWQRILCLIFAAVFCLSVTVPVSAAQASQNTGAATDEAAAGTDGAVSGTDGAAAGTDETGSGTDETGSDTDEASGEDGESEEPERLEPDAYFEPIQTDEIAGWPAGPAVWAESAVVMDLDSGTFLYSKNMDAVKYPASITKIMTTLLAIENSSPYERVTFSENAIYGIERDSSHIGIRVGEILSMDECWYGMMLESANEVCLAVAEHISGSVDAFVELMNQKAAELGCTNTHFTNPNGLPDENHYTTAHDMALIAQAAYNNRTFRKVCRTQYYLIPKTNQSGEERWLNNHHKMLPERTYAYDGCTGGKTGFTMAALNTLVTYAERDGRRLVCVSLRTNGAQIYADTASLLDYGFNNFQNITLYNRSTSPGAHMLYPSLYSGQPSTIDVLRPSTVITIPVTASQDQVETVCSADAQTLSRTYLYNQYEVGRESVTNGLSLLQTGENIHPIEAIQPDPITSDAESEAPEANDSSKFSFLQSIPAIHTIFNTLARLPVYIYLLIFLLILLILVEIVLMVKKIKRKKKRRQSQKKSKKKK